VYVVDGFITKEAAQIWLDDSLLELGKGDADSSVE
jgi:hypothetical protein